MSESPAHRHHPLHPPEGGRPAPRPRGAAAAWADRQAEGEARLRALIEHSSEFIAVVDADSRFLYVNPAAQRVLGRRSAELVGLEGLKLVHPDDLTEALEQLAACLRAPG